MAAASGSGRDKDLGGACHADGAFELVAFRIRSVALGTNEGAGAPASKPLEATEKPAEDLGGNLGIDDHAILQSGHAPNPCRPLDEAGHSPRSDARNRRPEINRKIGIAKHAQQRHRGIYDKKTIPSRKDFNKNPHPMDSSVQIDVNLGSRTYPVLVGSGILESLGETLRKHRFKETNAFVVTNPQVGAHYFPAVATSLEGAGFSRVVRHDIPAMEAGKNWEEFSRTCAALLESFPDTISIPLVILLGGGVVGDLGGFASAVFRRGVPFVQVPTTLLAAVDSSVGGKVAVNFGGVKNIMGAFAQPRLVFCDLKTLETLPAREVRSGAAEVIKYGAVCSAALFTQLECGDLEKLLGRDAATLTDVVAQCVRLKAEVVEQDEFDKKGIRNILNFGHTVGHALELSAEYALTHGEAISIGMIAATKLAQSLGMVGADFAERLRALILRAGLPVSFSGEAALFDQVLRAMQMDKKFRNGKNVFVLPTGVGSWQQREDVNWGLVHEALRSVLGEGAK